MALFRVLFVLSCGPQPLSDSEMGAMQQLVQETLGFASVSRELEVRFAVGSQRTLYSSSL